MSTTVIDRAAEFFTDLQERLVEAIADAAVRYNRDSHAQESLYLWTDNRCVIHLVHQTYNPRAIDDPPSDGFPSLTFTHQDGVEYYAALEISTATKTSLVWQNHNGANFTTEEIFELILSTYKHQSERDPAEFVDIL